MPCPTRCITVQSRPLNKTRVPKKAHPTMHGCGTWPRHAGRARTPSTAPDAQLCMAVDKGVLEEAEAPPDFL